ncbi:MAG: restriction endonuclease subunit S [Candidatus Vecturithrix sp.]|jgi:type I restriction enzyme S subunit|nr:restriction endonuclease subunit S [Candidatus Vecturithrix sp.]
MRANWQTRKLEAVADFCLGKMLDQKKNRGEPLPYLANVNVRWGEFDLADLREMRFEQHELDRYGLKYGDIVMCEGGEPGRCAIWKEQRSSMMIQKALHRIRPHDCLRPEFLYYFFLYKGRTGHLSSLFTGSTIKHLPREKLALVEVPVPPHYIQGRIASILSAYDNLIENNRRRIQLLEQAARLLYKEWFVYLRFPGHEHSKIVDGVPEGWERTTVGELASFISRGITPKYDDDAPGIVINQKCIRNRMVSLDLARHQTKKVPPAKLVQSCDVLINSTGAGTLGRVAQLLFSIDEGTVDSHVTIVRPKKGVPIHYFGMHITGLESYIATLGRGATNQTELSKDDV